MTRKVKSWKTDTVPHEQMILRMVDVRRDTADDNLRTVRVAVATENPVERWDDASGDVYHEVLLMDGVEFRNGRNQLPIVDSHDRSTIRNVLGSIRDLQTVGGELIGTANFARDEDSQIAYEKIRDGHLTDFSITAHGVDVVEVKRGQVAHFGAREITGPALVFQRWRPTDASLVAAGADETATVRAVLRSYDIAKRGTEMESTTRTMSDEMREALVANGMPEQIADAEQALAWAVGVLGSATPEATEEVANEEPPEDEDTEEMVVENEDAMDDEEKKTDVAQSVDRALKSERERRREITAVCRKANVDQEFVDRLVDSDATVDIARKQVLDHLISRSGPIGQTIVFGASSSEKTEAAMRDGLIIRAFQGAAVRAKPFDANNKPAPGHEDFARMSLRRMAEAWLRGIGVNTERMIDREIALAAMGDPSTIRRFGIRRDAYHTTGSFPALMLDAQNKTLLAGYEEAPYTWSMWARQAASVADFRAVHRIRFSEAPDLQVVPEAHAYPDGAMSDQKESYVVEKYGAIFSVTWETIVNDDLDALSRIPAMHGNAARRKQNKVVYQVLFNNPTMSDSVALFGSHASGVNLDPDGAAPSVAELNAAFVAMMTQTGLNSDTIINVQPRYLIVPATIAATALQLTASLADPSVGGDTAGNSNTHNIYGPNGSRPLQVIVEPLLDGNSTTAWYLAADAGQIDTVELAFLQGEESPVLESEWDFDRDCFKNKIRQTFGAAAIDWRGLFKNPGT